MTNTRGGAISTDVIWHPAIDAGTAAKPILQLGNGAFVGTSLLQGISATLIFSSDGIIHVTLPEYSPILVTEGGLVVTSGSAAYLLDSAGTAMQQMRESPYESWGSTAFIATATSVQEVLPSRPTVATTFAGIPNGNPSIERTYVAMFQGPHLVPKFTLQAWGGTCSRNPTPGSSGTLLSSGTIYDAKAALLSVPPSFNSATCSDFFHETTERLNYYFASTIKETRL